MMQKFTVLGCSLCRSPYLPYSAESSKDVCVGPAHASGPRGGLLEGGAALLGMLCAAPGHQQAQRR